MEVSEYELRNMLGEMTSVKHDLKRLARDIDSLTTKLAVKIIDARKERRKKNAG